MKKITLMVLLGFICSSFIYAQSLDEAILAAVVKISRDLPAGSKAAIISFNSPSDELNNYVIEELYGNILRNRRITPIKPNQRQFRIIQNELRINISGEMDAESILAIGQLLEVDYLITGSLEQTGVEYRLVLNAIDTEYAELDSQYTASLNLRTDQLFSLLLNSAIQRVTQESQQETVTSNQTIESLHQDIAFSDVQNESVSQESQQTNTNNRSVEPSQRISTQNNLDNSSWRNKWLYLGGCAMFGSRIGYSDDRNFSNLGFTIECSLFPYFSLEMTLLSGSLDRWTSNNTYYEYSDRIIPFFSGKVGRRFSRVELSLDLSGFAWYDIFIGATFGLNVGPGVLFFRLHGSFWSSSIFSFIGYKVGVGDRQGRAF